MYQLHSPRKSPETIQPNSPLDSHRRILPGTLGCIPPGNPHGDHSAIHLRSHKERHPGNLAEDPQRNLLCVLQHRCQAMYTALNHTVHTRLGSQSATLLRIRREMRPLVLWNILQSLQHGWISRSIASEIASFWDKLLFQRKINWQTRLQLIESEN